MRCVEPFVKAGEVYPCGKCLPCRYRTRRIWFHRVLLEASQHEYSAVATLTYDEAAVPATGQLDPAHLRNWLKRYRKRALERYPWRHLRFIACGEYGAQSNRPHYHVVLFGQPSCEKGRTGRLWCSDCDCETCCDLTETWSLGAVSVDRLSRESAAYVAGYVTRKIQAKSGGFMRMSNRPGIGANAMHDVASTLLQYGLPVPFVLVHGQRPMLLGRYLRRKLHEYVARPVEAPVPSAAMQAVRDYAWSRGVSQASVFYELNNAYSSQLAQKEALQEKVL